MPSPVRRSARGQPAPASSTSSSLSSRQDRGARGSQPQKSGTPRSLSSEEVAEAPAARRSQRQPVPKEDSSKPETAEDNDNDEEAIEEEEITRCICGHQEYPGPPLSPAFDGIVDAQADDVGGLFILCDRCSVWQHGGCVGIAEESQCPDKYYCEQCRPKLHALSTDSRGQKYSLYTPLHPNALPQPRPSISKHDDKAKKERDSVVSRASVDPSTGRRRATMRSKEHDDEEEQLKRAIEESKREVDSNAGSSRRTTKRGRDDSSEDSSSKQDNKRQRTASESLPSIAQTASIENDSDDVTTTANKSKKAKAEALITARQAEQGKKEKEREQARTEAASRRQDRARSRRHEAEINEESTPKPTVSDQTSPPAPSSQPPSPPPAEKVSHKKGQGKKSGKKLGNNQFTKNRIEQSHFSPHGRKRPLQNLTSASGDDASETAGNVDSIGGNSGASKNSPGAAAPNENNLTSKGKVGRGKKASGNGNGGRGSGEEMERTFANMQAVLKNMGAYVTKEQDNTGFNGHGDKGTWVAEDGPPTSSSGGLQAPSVRSTDKRRFEELNSVEMAERLQKGIQSWQQQWGHLAAA